MAGGARGFARVLVLGLCLVATGCALRSRTVEPVALDWAVVQALPPGALARVDLRWSEPVRGEVLTVDADAIELAFGTIVGRQTRRLERTHVTRVFTLGPRQTARYAKIGMVIGLGGSVLGIIVPTGVGGWNVPATLWFTALGAGLGAAGGAGTREQTLIYAAPDGGGRGGR